MLLYILVLCLVIFTSSLAQKTERIRYVILTVMFFSLLAGLRDSSVGLDTQSYCNIFEAIRLNDYTLAWRNIERGFIEICKFLLKINRDDNFLLFSFAFVANGFIIFRLWDFRKISSFPIAIVSYYATFYFLSINIIRQFCAIAIIFWGTRYLKEKKYIAYLICVLSAFVFHRSALVGLLYYYFEIKEWKKLKISSKLFFIAGILAVPFCIKYIMTNLDFYLRYFETLSVDIGIMLPVKLIFLAMCSSSLKKYSHNENDNDFELCKYKRYYGVGIILTFSGYIFLFLNRIGLVFYIYECVFWGAIFKITSKYSLYRMIIIILITYSTIIQFLGNGQGILPYKFFWSEY